MFPVLATTLVVFVAAEAFLAGAVIYHLRKFTLPGWTAVKIVLPTYFLLSLAFFGFALYFLVQVPR